ncbi:MAG: SPOR domain-containing protein [Sphingomicrobium sp.]
MRHGMRSVALMALLMAVAAPANAQSVKAGIEAWQRADYDSAVKIWRPLAEAGDADAAFNLGQAYRLGRGVPISLAAAQTWLERSARNGHLDAQTTLGLLLFNGGNRVSGLRWLKTAAEQGEPRALLIYGTALFNGDGVVRDPVLAYAYVSRAAAQGLFAAKTTLAEMDKLIPLDQRKKGVALAQQSVAAAKPEPKAKAQPPPKTTATKTPKPTPKPAGQAATPTPASGAWRIQLGAFSKRESAEALFDKLSGNAALAGRRPFYVAAGAVTRLQVGPFESRAAAGRACAALTAKGQACFAVAAK